MHTPESPLARREQGMLLATAGHVVLLLVVLGQVVFLASRYRLRLDGTADRIYTLTESTTEIVAKLEKRLVIEAYCSEKGALPSQLRDSRTVLDNFLDELVQLGRGKVVVQRFNPEADKVVQDKCTRVGVKPIDARSSSSSSIQLNRHWQGLRLVYAGGRQKVIEQLAPMSAFMAEAILTPAIKEVATKEKKRIGYMEWPSSPTPGQQQAQGNGWNTVRTMDEVAKRYELQNLRNSEGPLVPDDFDTLLLFRPNDLSDRQKYVIDQFVMRGGTLVVFAEAAEYMVGPRRSLSKVPGGDDAKDSQVKWQDQLLGYGIDARGMVVADMAQAAVTPQNVMVAPYEYLALVNPGRMGMNPVPYSYFFHPVAIDWAKQADQIATNPQTRQKDEALAEEYRKRFRPGIDSDEFLFKAFQQIGRGPGFYWPCWTDLRRKNGVVDLPAGVTGRVMLWSSPYALAEEPPASLDPVGSGDRPSQLAVYQQFQQKLVTRLQSEPRQQAPLMVQVQGTFASFFAGRPRVKKPSEIAEEEARKKEQEAKEQEAKDQEGKEQPAKEDAAAAVDPAKPQDPAKDPAKEPAKQGPPPPPGHDADTGETKPQEPEPLQQSKVPGRIVVIGDSDFIRDDFVRGDYAQMGGPVSLSGRGFFLMLLDWLNQDRDLLALQSRVPVDRRLELVASQLGKIENPIEAEQRLRKQTRWLVGLNVAIPCVVLLTVGLVVGLLRRAQKRAFLSSIGN